MIEQITFGFRNEQVKEMRRLYDERSVAVFYGKQNSVILFGCRTEKDKATRTSVPSST